MERSTDDARTVTQAPEDVPAGQGEEETPEAGVDELSVPDEPLPEETAEPTMSDEPPAQEEPSAEEAVAGHGGPLSQSADVRDSELAVELPSEEVAPAAPEMDLPVEEGEEARDEMADAPAEGADVEASEAQPAEAEPEAASEAEAEPAAEPPPAQAEPAAAKAERRPEPEEEPAARGRDPFRGPGDWYVVHTYAGYENKVKANLESRIGSMQMQEKIFEVEIPMEDVMEIKGGKKQVVQKKVFPGYLLVKMVYDNDSWYVVRNTPGVTGFVSSGTGTKPTPLSKREVEKILAVKQEEVKPTFRLEFEEGDVVRIISGPFADFNGTVDEINVDQSKLKVLVNIFDRETPVELGFDQVAKV